MRSKYIFIILVLIVLVPIAIGQVKIEKDGDSTRITPTFEKKVLVQTEIDPNFPCHTDGVSIICEAVNITQLEGMKKELNFIDKTRLNLFGVPVRNLEGSAVNQKSIDPEERTVIDIDLTKSGTIRVGFNSNEFTLTDLSQGTFNNTQELSGNVRVEGTDLIGQYVSEIVDTNETRAVVNTSFSSSEPAGTDIGIKFRTLNRTIQGAVSTNITDSLLAYFKFDGSNLIDYSEKGPTLYSSVDIGDMQSDNFILEGPMDGSYAYELRSSESRNIILNNFLPQGTIYSEGVSTGAWVRPDQTGTTQLIYERKWGAWSMRLSGGSFQCELKPNGGSTQRISSSMNYDVGRWYFVTCVIDSANELIIYVDGVEEGRDTNTGWSGTFTTADGDTYVASRPNNANFIDAAIAELYFLNRTLSAQEIIDLNNSFIYNWSAYSSSYSSSPSDISVDDGRYVQFSAEFTRTTGTEVVELEDLTFSTDAAGAGGPVDNPPTVTLETPDLTAFSIENFTLNTSATDDFNLVNATLYNNESGTWQANQTIGITGVQSNVSFNISKHPDGGFIWNVLFADNASQISFATANISYTVSTTCMDSQCSDGFVCNPATNSCFTSCTSHASCNATSFCSSTSTCDIQIADTLSCNSVEFSGLDDNDACIGGYCFNDDIGATDEFCTADATGCIDDGVEFAEGGINCVAPDNDYNQCTGGESSWGSLIDCADLGDPNTGDTGKASLGHDYCGFLNAQTCSTSLGCVDPATPTVDCGSYFFNSTEGVCGDLVAGADDTIKRNACDATCGAAYDLETCAFPNTLSVDCSTCTPPEVNEPPIVTLSSPGDTINQTTTAIDFEYLVTDSDALQNCSLFLGTDISTFQFNVSNSSSISKVITNTFPTRNFPDGSNVTWNVQCIDSINQTAFASQNFTFSIDTSVISEVLFGVLNQTENIAEDLLFGVTDNGVVNVTNDLYVFGDFFLHGTQIGLSPLKAGNLEVLDFIELNSTGLIGVRLTNPFNEYLKIESSSGTSDLLFGFFDYSPFIDTTTSDRITFADTIVSQGDFNTSGTLYINGSIDVQSLGGGSGDGAIISNTSLSLITNNSFSQVGNVTYRRLSDTINEANISDLSHTVDTTIANETVRIGELISGDCGSGFLVIGIESNGTVKCAADADTVGDPLWDATFNTSFDHRDSDTTYTAGDALTLDGTTIDFDGGTAPAGDLGGTWASPSVDDDSHNHIYSNIDAFTEANLYTRLSDVTEFLETNDAGVLTTLNTGQGANELYDMDQNVQTTDSPQFRNLEIESGDNYGIKFWNGNSNYMISMGDDQNNDGTVTGYSIHHNIGATAGRGFTFGSSNTAVSASINALTGDFHTDGDITVDTELNVDDIEAPSGILDFSNDELANVNGIRVGSASSPGGWGIHSTLPIYTNSYLIVANTVTAGGTSTYAYNSFGGAGSDDGLNSVDDVFVADDLEVDGTFYLTGGYTSIVNSDIAENLQTIESRRLTLCLGEAERTGKPESECNIDSYVKDLQEGEVVCIDERYGQVIKRCDGKYSKAVAGVVSNTSIINMGNNGRLAYPIGIAGLVWTKVTLEGGAIRPTDAIVSSSTPGRGMKGVDDPIFSFQRVLGKSYDFCNKDNANEKGECDILMFIALG
jgi:hypothetical protein